VNGMLTKEETLEWLTRIERWKEQSAVALSYQWITHGQLPDSITKTGLHSGREPGFKGNSTEACSLTFQN
jgi:hypothetical protein